MTDSNISELREPILAQHETEDRYCSEEEFPASGEDGNGDGDGGDGEDDLDSSSSTSSYEWFPYPPEVVKDAEKVMWQCFGIFSANLAVKSLWSESILPIFVALAWNYDRSYVGFVQATIGISQTLSFEMGEWTTRQYNRKTLFRKVRAVGTLTALLHLCWCRWAWGNGEGRFGTNTSFVWFIGVCGLWGLFWGLLEVLLPMVLVEAVYLVIRKTKETAQGFLNKLPLASSIGTLITIFIIYRNDIFYEVETCLKVMTWGVVGNGMVVMALWFLKPVGPGDDDDDEEYYSANENDGGEETPEYAKEDDEEEWYEPLISQNDLAESNEGQQDPLMVEEGADDDSETSSDSSSGCCLDDKLLIPVCIHLADLLSSIAGGLSAWYFPLFLMMIFKVPFVWLQFLYLIIPAGQKLTLSLANDFSRAIGPCLTCILFQLAYILLLLLMLVCEYKGEWRGCPAAWSQCPVWKICILYFLHGSLMNSTSSLSKRLLQEHVPWEEQHKWDFSRTLQKILWSLSGLLGGWVAKSKWGFLTNFYSTAALQFLACLPLVLLYCLRNPQLNETKCDDDDVSSHEEEEEQQGDNTTTCSPSSVFKNGQEVVCQLYQDTEKNTLNVSPLSELSTASTPQTEPAESDFDNDSNEEDYHDALSTTWMI